MLLQLNLNKLKSCIAQTNWPLKIELIKLPPTPRHGKREREADRERERERERDSTGMGGGQPEAGGHTTPALASTRKIEQVGDDMDTESKTLIRPKARRLNFDITGMAPLTLFQPGLEPKP